MHTKAAFNKNMIKKCSKNINVIFYCNISKCNLFKAEFVSFT